MDKTAGQTRPGAERAQRTEPLAAYDWFERFASGVLLVGMVAVILLATANFFLSLAPEIMMADRVRDYATFQELFDKALAAVIAIELAHSVFQSARGVHGLYQVRIVVLIGILAVVRKFVLIDIETESGMLILGLGVAVLALGVVYAMTHWIEQRLRGAELERDVAEGERKA